MKKVVMLLFFFILLFFVGNDVYAIQNLNDELCIVAPGASLTDAQIQAGCNVPIYVDQSGKIINPSSENSMWDVSPESVTPPSNAVNPNDVKTTNTTTKKPVNFCADTNVLKAMRIVGTLIFIIKIVVPVVLIIMAMIKLAQVIISDEDVSDAGKNVFQKFIIGVLIFFIPTLLSAIISVVDGYDDIESKFARCSSCLFEPNGPICKAYIK